MNQAQLCEAISQIIQGYADDRYGVYDAAHVNRWIEQFDDNERQLVLEETLHIFQNQYITRDKFTELVSTVIDFDKIHNGTPVNSGKMRLFCKFNSMEIVKMNLIESFLMFYKISIK